MYSGATRRLRLRRRIGPATAALVSCLVMAALPACVQPARSDSTAAPIDSSLSRTTSHSSRTP